MLRKQVRKISGQFLYNGRMVDKDTFRAFVYNAKGEQKLAPGYLDYEDLIATGVWFPEKGVVLPEKPRAKRKRIAPVPELNTVCEQAVADDGNGQ